MILKKKIIILPVLCALTAPTSVSSCGSNCGKIFNYPIVAGIRFNLDDCNLYDSHIYLEAGPRKIWKFAPSESGMDAGLCTSEFKWVTYKGYYSWHFNSFTASLTDTDTCSGSFRWDFSSSYGGDSSGTFKNAKVLCNDGQYLALLVKDPRSYRSYALYFETSTSKNYLTEYDSLTTSIPTKTGKYCKAMFPLMSDILAYLKSSSSNFDRLPSACGGTIGSSNTSSESSSNTGAIIGGVVGGVAALILLVGMLICYQRRKRRQCEVLEDTAVFKSTLEQQTPVVNTPNEQVVTQENVPPAPPEQEVPIASPPEVTTTPAASPPVVSITEEIETLPDGRMKVTKTTEDATGTKMIEETIYPEGHYNKV